MAISNHERVGKALELLKEGLRPFVERELKTYHGDRWASEVKEVLSDTRLGGGKADAMQDVAVQLVIMDRTWGDVFRKTLGQAERSLVSELRDVRNQWAHQEPFSGDDAYRALDSAARLLTAVSAPQADEIEKMKMELLRLRFDEQVRGEKRKSAGTAIESAGDRQPQALARGGDAAQGRGQRPLPAGRVRRRPVAGAPGRRARTSTENPVEFFRRTYLTESLKRLLVGAVRRLAGQGGDPVVQLQTNFGGGKTHSMLALYHLFSGIAPERAGRRRRGAAGGGREEAADRAKRVVLVGNKISPGNPVTKPDGTVVRTLWGELAWQLGGKKAFARVKADDEKATSPGDVLRELFNEYGPCLILIDEWVAYARQLHDQSDLPAGGFETQFTFAQVLTESAKLAKNCLLVISLPASDTAGSPHTQADDVEVGGQRGREALDRLRNVVGRVESSWRPASAEEGFEIVRRRLFEPLADPAQFKDRDVVARAFADLYRTQHQEFPPECRDADYEKRIKAAYPIHPEIFDRLYTDWSTLVKFQRTRGVLRLMAAVIHSLWEKGDRNPLILPANIPIDDPRVQFELTRYLSDNWVPVIEKDVDGPSSLPLRLDGEVPNLGKFAACRRVARTIYLGSAPTTHGRAPRARGPARQARLRDAGRVAGGLRRCAAAAGRRRRPTSTRMARATGTRRSRRSPSWPRTAPSSSSAIPTRWCRSWTSGCARTCARRATSAASTRCRSRAQDVPDDLDARLVVLGVDHPYSKEPGSAAEAAAQGDPRVARQHAAPLPQHARLPRGGQDAAAGPRRGGAPYLAWESILAEKETLNLDPHQVKQAETQKAAADGAVTARLPETYQWLLVPVQATPQAPSSGRRSGSRAGRAGRAREQEAAERRAAGHRLRGHAAADGAGPRAALARRSCRRSSSSSRTSRAISTCRGSRIPRCCWARSGTALGC